MSGSRDLTLGCDRVAETLSARNVFKAISEGFNVKRLAQE
jgi:hypothetical protein